EATLHTVDVERVTSSEQRLLDLQVDALALHGAFDVLHVADVEQLFIGDARALDQQLRADTGQPRRALHLEVETGAGGLQPVRERVAREGAALLSLGGRGLRFWRGGRRRRGLRGGGAAAG